MTEDFTYMLCKVRLRNLKIVLNACYIIKKEDILIVLCYALFTLVFCNREAKSPANEYCKTVSIAKTYLRFTVTNHWCAFVLPSPS